MILIFLKGKKTYSRRSSRKRFKCKNSNYSISDMY